MDFGLVLYSAVVGAVLGGLGSLIGQRIGKRFPDKAKVITQVLSVVGVVIAIAIAPALRQAMSGEGASAAARVGRSPADLVAEYDGVFRADPLLGKIATGWPTEYQTFLQEAVSRDGQVDNEQAHQMGFDFTTGIRRDNASNALFADDAGLRKYFAAYRVMLLDINAQEGEALCSDFMLEGAIALRGRGSAYFEHLRHLGAITLDVLLEGRDKRDSGAAPVDPPPQEAFNAFENFLIDRTGEQDLLERMRKGQGPNACTNGIHVMAALAEFAPDQPNGRALRIAIFNEIAAS